MHETSRTAIDLALANSRPRRLRCFDDDETWFGYLRVVHESGDKLTKRSDTGKHRGDRHVIQILVAGASKKACEDCEAGFQRRMKAAGRCERVSPGNAARHWLKALLAAGPMLSSAVLALARAQGFTRRTAYRAAQRVGVLRRRMDPTRPETTTWGLPLRRDCQLSAPSAHTGALVAGL
jgi:hypothetical protein